MKQILALVAFFFSIIGQSFAESSILRGHAMGGAEFCFESEDQLKNADLFQGYSTTNFIKRRSDLGNSVDSCVKEYTQGEDKYLTYNVKLSLMDKEMAVAITQIKDNRAGGSTSKSTSVYGDCIQRPTCCRSITQF